MIIQRDSLRTKNKTCSKEYSLREYRKKTANKRFFCLYFVLDSRREYNQSSISRVLNPSVAKISNSLFSFTKI